jgi:hypothetical protein
VQAAFGGFDEAFQVHEREDDAFVLHLRVAVHCFDEVEDGFGGGDVRGLVHRIVSASFRHCVHREWFGLVCNKVVRKLTSCIACR